MEMQGYQDYLRGWKGSPNYEAQMSFLVMRGEICVYGGSVGSYVCNCMY